MTGRLLQLAAAAFVGVFCPAVAAAAPGQNPSRQPRPVVVEASRVGFDWGDAAIGAAAGLGLGLAASGVLVRRGDRSAAQ